MSRIPGAGNSSRTSWSSCLAFSRWAASFLARGFVDDAGAAPPSVSPEERWGRELDVAALGAGWPSDNDGLAGWLTGADAGWRSDSDGLVGWLEGVDAGWRSDNDGLAGAEAGWRSDNDGLAGCPVGAEAGAWTEDVAGCAVPGLIRRRRNGKSVRGAEGLFTRGPYRLIP